MRPVGDFHVFFFSDDPTGLKKNMDTHFAPGKLEKFSLLECLRFDVEII